MKTEGDASCSCISAVRRTESAKVRYRLPPEMKAPSASRRKRAQGRKCVQTAVCLFVCECVCVGPSHIKKHLAAFLRRLSGDSSQPGRMEGRREGKVNEEQGAKRKIRWNITSLLQCSH